MKTEKNEYKLQDVKLKTVLIQPPFIDLQVASSIPLLGIPTLQGFLKSKGYKNIEAIDLNQIWGIKTDVNFEKNSSLIKKVLSLTIFKKFILINSPIKQGSLNQILCSIIKNDFLNKKEIKKIRHYINSYILNKNPDIIGISVTYPYQIFYSLLISEIIKEIKKNVFIVLGGAQISKNIRYLIQNRGMTRIIDGFVVGDGEEPLAKLICQLNEKKGLEKIPNFYFKEYDTKSKSYYTKSSLVYFYNPKKEIIIPDFLGFKLKKIVPIRASVGCPWGKCTFCTYKNTHKKNIYSKPEEIVFLIEYLLKKYKIKKFWFVDNALTAEFLEKFSKQILSKRIKIQWNNSFYFQSKLLNKTFIKTIAKAGCKSVGFGLESMSPRVLKLMNKSQKDPKKVINALKLFKKYKINVRVSVIFGFPSETEEEAKMTLGFLMNRQDLYSYAVPHQFILEDDVFIFKNPHKLGISKVCKKDKICDNHNKIGFYYNTRKGMTLQESKEFTDYARKSLCQQNKILKGSFIELFG